MERKYPAKMFILGLVMNFLFHYFYLFLPGVIFCIIGIRNLLSLRVGLMILGVDLALSIVEQIRIRNAVLSDSDSPEFNQLMDTFYGSGEGESIEAVIEQGWQQEEEAQRESQAILQKLVVYRTLRDTVREGMTLDEMITAFEKMCEISVGDPDDLLFQTGTYDFTGRKLFHFNLVRQFQFMDEDEYVQLHLDVTYEPGVKTFGLRRTHWGDRFDNEFFQTVRTSREYSVVKDLPMARVEVRVEET